jgi:hypothetical protein
VDNFSEIPPDFEGEVSEVFNRRGPDIQFQEELALATGKPKPKASSALKTPHFPFKKKGLRMLNGQVYGARRVSEQNTNLFVTDGEPGFVDVGVRSITGRPGGMQWSQLQSNSGVGDALTRGHIK